MNTHNKIGSGATAGASAAFRSLQRRERSGLAWATRRIRYLKGRTEGERYHLTGRHPDPNVSDDILADRVRTELGTLVKQLDIPHPHVTVTEHVVTLHGDVATAEDAYVLEEAAAAVSGIDGVISLLHEGLLRSDTRPSRGAEQQHSAAFRRLLASARAAGCPDHAVRAAVRLVLAGFFEHLRERDRVHLASHLPVDVKQLAFPPRRTGIALSSVHDNMEPFIDAVVRLDSISRATAHDIVVAALRTLRDVVPDQARDIESSVPLELREVWDAVPHIGTETGAG